MTPQGKDPFVECVRATIDEFDLLPPGERVLVALSGGADSMALLHALMKLGFLVEAAHLNHMLRGDASDRDQEFVVTHCAGLGVLCHCASDNVAGHALDTGQSIETAARERRYEFLCGIAALNGIATIATGHHADDQAETILMRLLRGAGSAGLAGIPPFREEDDVAIVRPLLRCTRKEISAWLTAQDIDWREDASNDNPAFLRNRVRHGLIPQLEQEYNPQLPGALCRLADNLREDAALLDSISDKAAAQIIDEDGRIGVMAFSDFPAAIQRRIVQQWLWYVGTDLDSDRLRDAVRFVTESGAGKYFDAGGGIKLYRGKAFVEIVEEPDDDFESHELAAPGKTVALGHCFTLSIQELNDPQRRANLLASLAADCNPSRQMLDADAVGTPIILRTRRDGDRFVPFGMTGSRKLQDFFVDKGVPSPQRDKTPIVTADSSIVWIVGHAIDARFAVTKRTVRILVIEVDDAAE